MPAALIADSVELDERPAHPVARRHDRPRRRASLRRRRSCRAACAICGTSTVCSRAVRPIPRTSPSAPRTTGSAPQVARALRLAAASMATVADRSTPADRLYRRRLLARNGWGRATRPLRASPSTCARTGCACRRDAGPAFMDQVAQAGEKLIVARCRPPRCLRGQFKLKVRPCDRYAPSNECTSPEIGEARSAAPHSGSVA